MIDLTPLDVRNKRSDFRKALRGYDPQEVDVFLLMVAERLEALVRENIQLRERAEVLQQQVASSSARERAVQEALVTAQELRADIRAQAQREAELVVQEAQGEARRRIEEAELVVQEAQGEARRRMEENERKRAAIDGSLVELERRRMRFLKSFRQLLERELDGVEVEEARAPLEDQAIEMQLGGGHRIEVYEGEMEEVEVGDSEVSEEAVAATVSEEAVAATPSEDALEIVAAEKDEGEEAPDIQVLEYDAGEPGEDRVPLDSAVHELARQHVEEEEILEASPPRREDGLFRLPDLPAPGDSDDIMWP